VRPTLDTVRLRAYAAARRAFLYAIGIPDSLRDPLSEFSERIVATALSAELATSRVQRGTT
jgi:hypothetical protein